MEGVHGVDVSWLHHANKDPNGRRTTSNGNIEKSPRNKDTTPNSTTKPTIRKIASEGPRAPNQPHVTPPTLSEAKKDDTPAVSSMASPLPSPTPNGHSRTQSSTKRPQIGSRTNSEKSIEDGSKSASRRPGWLNNLSSKLSSSQSTPTRTSQASTLPLKSPPLTGGSMLGSPATGEAVEVAEPYVPSKPRESGSFFSSLSRRLSSNSQVTNSTRVSTTGAICPRRTLNIDPNRERCLVPELDGNKLRKVSFCVDVEIAGGPKYKDEPEDDVDRNRKRKEVKMKERAEGEALRNPVAVQEELNKSGEQGLETRSRSSSTANQPSGQAGQEDEGDRSPLPRDSMDGESMSRKKEKKKRSEAERKERKEQRIRRAQESGQIPVEIGGDEENDSNETTPASATPATDATTVPKPRTDRPTTDPARIYRRCCQLRETPILKRITEQLMSPKSVLPNEPGVVSCLDLTGSRMQLPDVVTLGDWLAVVPVKRLLLEDADLNDEGVRCVLAGLIAAKRPEPTKRKFANPRHREGLGIKERYQERSGVVEKVTFKNNPRISRVGWKHISLFIYMCRSIKAIDLSMNKFPDTIPASSQSPATPKTPQDSSPKPSAEIDSAEILYKCLSERVGGSRLEELSISECGLRAAHVRKIVDGAMICGISRLGLAGNNLNDAGLDHVMHYIKSGICHGIDLGGNNLRGKLDRIADSLVARPNNPCWGLSLADCDLDAESVKPLFPALVQLPNFRFVDLSHNRKLCKSTDSKYNIITLLRRYIPQLKELKRIHLNNVGMTAKQAIALAEVLPEGPRLAHVSVLENLKLTALANGTDEATQEEACALYASFMMAVRCSKTLICIDLDVPSAENSEVVKALAKQVVAYSLRNMEDFAVPDLTGEGTPSADAAAQLTAPHGGEKGLKNVTYPDVLMHLVGHVEGVPENHDDDDPAPDSDYIVGGTGVVKAMQYVLGEKANDRRTSVPGSPASGARGSRPGSSAGLDQLGRAKAKQMSRNLLETARKIRKRLHPAIMKEATAGDEMAYRRLQYLDHTLQSMIDRFEEEYPETRTLESNSQTSMFLDISKRNPEVASTEDEVPADLDLNADEDEDESEMHPGFQRRNSDASLASRSMTLEEGRLHRLGHRLRRDVVNSTSSPIVAPDDKPGDGGEKLKSERERIRALSERIESTPGEVLRPLIEQEGWTAVLKRFGANYEDIRTLSEQDPEGWEQFTDSMLKAKMNLDNHRAENGNLTKPGPNMF